MVSETLGIQIRSTKDWCLCDQIDGEAARPDPLSGVTTPVVSSFWVVLEAGV